MSSLKTVRDGQTRHPLYPLFLGIFGILCVIAGVVFAADYRGVPASAEGTGAVNAQPAISSSAGAVAGNPFRAVVKQITPAVVNITTEKTMTPQEAGGSPFGESPFNFRFGPPEEQSPFQGEQGEVIQTGGSGFIIDGEGHVITNNHVIEDALKIHVTLDTGEQMDAELVGTDPGTDVAVIKLKPEKAHKPFPYLRLGDSDLAEIGDWVIAVGSPLGLEQSVTVGVISAKNRNQVDIPGSKYKYNDFLQTDAAINFGNSGGPLLSINGDVLGMNTAIAGGPNVTGIGFAVPARKIKFVYDNLISSGTVKRGYIGIYVGDVTQYMAKANGLDIAKGAIVTEVDPNTPSGRAGLKFSDLILTVDGESVRNKQDLVNKVAEKGVGVTLTLGILRDAKPMDLRVTTEQRPEDIAPSQPRPIAGPGAEDNSTSESLTLNDIGLKVSNLDAELRSAIGLGEDIKGVYVDAVKRGSESDQEGIDQGDIITNVDGTAITDTAGFQRTLEKARGSYARITVKRMIQNEWVSLPFAIPVPEK